MDDLKNESIYSEGAGKFLEIKALFQRMSHEMFIVVENYHLWRAIVFAQSTVEAGEEKAAENVKIMNFHRYFFSPVEDSTLRHLVLGLMKFFDGDGRALSIGQLIKKIQECKTYLTPEVVLEVYPNRFKKEDILGSYAPLSDEDVKQIGDLATQHQSVIQTLKTIRDKQFAHTDIDMTPGSFVPNEVEKLIAATQEMFNMLSNRFDMSTTLWDHIEKEVESDTQLVLENLKRGEAERIAEINREL